jgi:hypothetical protein
MPEFVCKFTNANQTLSIKKFDDKKWKGNEGYQQPAAGLKEDG